jgi:hypothetical protein
MAMKTKGTSLYVKHPITGALYKFHCPKGIDDPGVTIPEVDATCLDSDGMESDPGMPSTGAVSVTFDFDTAVASHMLLQEFIRDGLQPEWVLGYSDGTVNPTIDNVTGEWVLPSGRSWEVYGPAYIAGLSKGFAVNANVASTMSFKPSGLPVTIPKSSS